MERVYPLKPGLNQLGSLADNEIALPANGVSRVHARLSVVGGELDVEDLASKNGTFVDAFGIRQPAPAPRFSRTTPEIAGPPPAPGEHGAAALADWGVSDDQIDALK